MPEKTPTIAKIAKKSGTSTSSVKKFLDPRRRGGLHPKTREPIERALLELGWLPVPSSGPGRRKAGRRHTLGILMSPSEDLFRSGYHAKLLAGIRDRTIEASGDLKFFILKESHFERIEEVLHRHGIDGLLVLSWRVHPKVIELVKGNQEGIPLVAVNDYDPTIRRDAVSSDVREGIRRAVFYLAGKGYRKIGMLAGPSEALILGGKEGGLYPVSSPDAREKLEGFLEAMEERGLAVKNKWIRECPSYREGDGVLEMRKWVEEGDLPEALVAANDEIALVMLGVLKKAGLRVPEDIALTGFDDIEKAELSCPALTTVRQPLYEMGVRAADLLIERIRLGCGEPVHERYIPELIVRETA